MSAPPGVDGARLVRRRVSARAVASLSAVAALLASACGPVQPFSAGGAPGHWQRRASIGTARDDFGLASFGGRLYAVGGMTGERGNALDTVEVYDPGANAWTRGPGLPAKTSSLRAAGLSGRLFAVAGAVDNGEVAEVWTLSSPTGQWVPVAPVRTARMGHGLAALGGALYVAGGLSRGEASAQVERYDPVRDRWDAVAPLPQPRFNLTLVPIGGKAYAVGGSGTDRRPAASVAIYDAERDRWETGPALPEPFSNFGAAALEGRLHVMLHKRHVALDPVRGTWQPLPPLPTSRHGLGLEALGGMLYAVGGCSEDPQRDLSVVEAYRT